jgi:hypothetical protein
MTPPAAPLVAARLQGGFDPSRLRQAYDETRRLFALAEHRAGHDGRAYHDGWAGVSLRSNGGHWRTSGPGRPGLEPFRDSEVTARVPYWREVLRAFPCPLESVRLSVLQAGGRIVPHHDDDVGFEFGRLRLHVPIVTSPDVCLLIEGQRCDFAPGEVWWGDFAREHSVTNAGREARAHLLLDVQISAALLARFPPEVLSAQPRIRTFPPAVTLDAATLRAWEGRFELPRGSQPAELLLEPLFPEERAAFPADGPPHRVEIALDGEHLRLALDGVPLYALEPVAAERLRLLGFPLRYELQRDSNGQVELRDERDTWPWQAR